MDARRLRLLVVDDSLFFRGMLTRGLSAFPDIEVVGEAYDPYAASDKIVDINPDVMTLDIEMPNMNGVEFLKILLPQWKIPVIVISSLAGAEDAARRAGAVDFMVKPDRSTTANEEFIKDLARRIRLAAKRQPGVPSALPKTNRNKDHVIAIGASTGGTQATGTILKALPADSNGIVIVQHMPPDFTRMYADGLNRDCAITVAEARDGDMIEQGKALIAPGGDQHMEVQRSGDGYCVRLRQGEKQSGHCPSVDVLFRSMAKVLPGKNTMGVILTGMGADGARGLLDMRRTGSYTIGQDEASCVVYGMPKEAFDLGAVTRQAPLGSIASLIVSYTKDLRH